MAITILNGDVLQHLRDLPDCSVHCCVTSPPYDDVRTYGQEKLYWDFQGTAKELYRVLCPGGVLCWNVNDMMINGSESLSHARQGIYFVDEVGFKLHDTMIYQRNGFSVPESVRYHQCFEYILILSKGAPRAFNPIKDRKNVTSGCGTLGEWSIRDREGKLNKGSGTRVSGEYGMRFNVWKGNTRGQENPCGTLPDHPAMMPRWLAHDLIISWSNRDDTILDPFAGSGTTLEQARLLKRHAIGIEINPKYVKDMKKNLRLNEQLPGVPT